MKPLHRHSSLRGGQTPTCASKPRWSSTKQSPPPHEIASLVFMLPVLSKVEGSPNEVLAMTAHDPRRPGVGRPTLRYSNAPPLPPSTLRIRSGQASTITLLRQGFGGRASTSTFSEQSLMPFGVLAAPGNDENGRRGWGCPLRRSSLSSLRSRFGGVGRLRRLDLTLDHSDFRFVLVLRSEEASLLCYSAK